MMAPVGSVLWLLRHEARMFFFNATFSAKDKKVTRHVGGARLTFWVVIALLIQAGALAIVFFLRSERFTPSPQVVMGVTGALLVVLSLMLSTALRASVEALFERGDLDLLLSSPLSSRTIFATRLGGVVIGVASIYLLLFGPLANAGLVLGQFQWLGIYPTVLSLAAFAASFGMLLTLALVRSIGVRRTKVVAQVIGAISGALIFLLSQIGTSFAAAWRARAMETVGPMLAPGAALGPDSMLWLPGRALLGSVWPMVLLSLAACAVLFATVHFTHAFFVRGLAQSVSQVRAAARPAGALRFRFESNVTRMVMMKEWRLIGRDTQLISQVLLQLLYMVPLMLMMFANGGGGMGPVGAALVFLCSSLSTSLTWIVVSAEDAPDLLRSAPCPSSLVRRAKLMAVAVPVLALAAVPAAWIVWRAPLAGLGFIVCVCGATVCGALAILWTGRPGARGDFKLRMRGSFLSGFFEWMGSMLWAGCVLCAINAAAGGDAVFFWLIGAAVTFALALLLCLGSWCLRTKT